MFQAAETKVGKHNSAFITNVCMKDSGEIIATPGMKA